MHAGRRRESILLQVVALVHYSATTVVGTLQGIVAGVDVGLAVKGGGHMHKHLTMPTFGISQWLTTTPKQKMMALPLEIIAISADIMCYCIILDKR